MGSISGLYASYLIDGRSRWRGGRWGIGCGTTATASAAVITAATTSCYGLYGKGKLQLAFAVEPVAGGGGGGNNGGGGGGGGSTPNTPSPTTPSTSTIYQVGGVQTGDASHILLWSVVALCAGLTLTVIAILRLRREKGGNGNEE